MDSQEVISKYQKYIDALDFKGLYDEGYVNSEDGLNLLPIMQDLVNLLEDDGISLFHQAKRLGFKVFDKPEDWENYCVKIVYKSSINLNNEARSFIEQVYNQYKSDFRLAQDEYEWEMNISIILQDIKDILLNSFSVGLLNYSVYGSLIYVEFNLKDKSTYTLFFKLGNSEYGWSFPNLGGCINEQKVRDKISTMFEEISNLVR